FCVMSIHSSCPLISISSAAFLSLYRPPPPTSTLFPYTTLFRSRQQPRKSLRSFVTMAQNQSRPPFKVTSYAYHQSHVTICRPPLPYCVTSRMHHYSSSTLNSVGGALLCCT